MDTIQQSSLASAHRGRRPRGTKALVIVLCAVVAVFDVGCSLVRPIGRGATELVFGDAQQRRIGAAAAQRFQSTRLRWKDPVLDAYVTGVMQRLVAVAKPRGFPYQVRIVNDPSVNAFSLPGGFLYVNMGMLMQLENEAQLAAVLGHEIAHVTERHSVERTLARFSLAMFAAAGILVSQQQPGAGSGTDEIYGFMVRTADNGYGRAQETEADEVGLDYMVRAGYDPHQAARLWERFYKVMRDRSFVDNFFHSDHPTHRQRQARMTELVTSKYASGLGNPALVVNTDEFEQQKHRLIALHEDPDVFAEDVPDTATEETD